MSLAAVDVDGCEGQIQSNSEIFSRLFVVGAMDPLEVGPM
jgi:hypothetical protein